MGPSRETHDVRRGRKSRSFSPSLEQLFWPILTTTSFLFHVLGLYLDPGEFKLPEHYVYDLIPSDFHGYNIVSCGFILIFGLELWVLSFLSVIWKRIGLMIIRDVYFIRCEIRVLLAYIQIRFPSLYPFIRVNYSPRERNRTPWIPVLRRTRGIIRSQTYDIIWAIMRTCLIPIEAAAHVAAFFFIRDEFMAKDALNNVRKHVQYIPCDVAWNITWNISLCMGRWSVQCQYLICESQESFSRFCFKFRCIHSV